jgi:hypothetical protein
MRFRYYLYSPDLKTKQKLKYDPLGWDSLGRTLERDMKTHGVMFSYSPKLKFIKDGRDFIASRYETLGIEANITLIIYRKNEVTRYWDVYYTGRLNLTKLKVTPTTAECNVDQTGFTQLFKNSQDIKQNISENGTLDIPLHSRTIKRVSNSLINENGVGNLNVGTHYVSLPIRANKENDLAELFEYDPGFSALDPVAFAKYNYLLKEGGQYTFNFTIQYTFTSSLDRIWNVKWYITTGKIGGYTTTQIGTTQTVSGGSILNGAQSGVVNRTLQPEDEVYIYGVLEVTSIIGSGSNTVNFLTLFNPFLEPVVDGMLTAINITGLTTFPASVAKGVLLYEAFERVITKNLSVPTNRFRSNYFGRTDRGYAQDGEGAIRSIHSGKSIRGFNITDNPVYINFKDLLESFQAIDGIGVGIQYINGIETVVVEKLDYFYNPTKICTIDFVRDIEKEVADELYYNELIFKYPEWNNEFVNNLDEFNSTREFVLPITQVKRRLQMMSAIIASGYTIEFVRRKPVTLGSTTDEDRDNFNFVVQLIRDGADYEPEKNAGITISNVIDPATVYNARLSPMRCILRNGQMIRSGLFKRDSANINLAFGEGNTRLQTTLTGGTLVNETTVPVASLGKPLWIPEFYSFKAPFKQEYQEALEANPYGYIEFSTDGKTRKKGYVVKIDPEADSELTSFKLLKANL